MTSGQEQMDVGKIPQVHKGHAAPLIQILAWLFLAYSILCVVAQFATKKAMSRRFASVDFVLVAALVSSLSMKSSRRTALTCVLADPGHRSGRHSPESCRSSHRKFTGWLVGGDDHGSMEGKILLKIM